MFESELGMVDRSEVYLNYTLCLTPFISSYGGFYVPAPSIL